MFDPIQHALIAIAIQIPIIIRLLAVRSRELSNLCVGPNRSRLSRAVGTVTSAYVSKNCIREFHYGKKGKRDIAIHLLHLSIHLQKPVCHTMLTFISILLLFIPLTLAKNATYATCQMPKPQGQQLNGCPNGTLYVSQTDPQAGYGQISSAIAALPNDT